MQSHAKGICKFAHREYANPCIGNLKRCHVLILLLTILGVKHTTSVVFEQFIWSNPEKILRRVSISKVNTLHFKHNYVILMPINVGISNGTDHLSVL